MIRYRLTLTPLSPIAVGEWMTSRSNVRESMSYIPGGVLRGALAQLILEHMGTHNSSRRTLGNQSQLQSLFQQVFAKDGAQFSFLMPFGAEWIPAPATALFNKQRSEYLYDTLFALFKGEPYPAQCPKTNERLERGRGYLVHANGGWGKAEPPRKTTFVRVGLNRQTEAAEEGVLYAIEAIDIASNQEDTEARPRFTGFVEFPDEACRQAFDALLDTLRWRCGAIRSRIGSARSRGFGEVVLACDPDTPQVQELHLEKFRERAGAPVFTLLARTPVIVYDECGLPAQSLTPELLRRSLPCLPDSVQLC